MRFAISVGSGFLAAVLLSATPFGPIQVRAQPLTPPAGTYRISGAESLESHGMYHFLYLDPSGRFLMAAEWVKRETSRAAGHWRMQNQELVLEGSVEVNTNEGQWKTVFRRMFKVALAEKTGSAQIVRLSPILEKNRYGMLGWPNTYLFHSARPEPNLPGSSLPTDAARMLTLIEKLTTKEANASAH